MSGNSSSSEDEYGKIKEAVDGTFLTEDLYANNELSKKSTNISKREPSLRYQDRQEVSLNPFTIKVTPEFQKHVSKHLSKLLDELIDDTEIIQKCKKLKVKRNVNSSVKLLSSSKDYIESSRDTNIQCDNVRKFVKKVDLNEVDYEKRAKEVAVSPEWVLSKEETKCWAPETKGKIEVIKLDNNNFGKTISKKRMKRKTS